MAITEGITLVSIDAGTRGKVFDNLTFGTLAARSGARILTPVTDAGSVRGAIRIQDTLGTTTFIGISKVILDAGTRSCTVLFPTDGIGTARTGHTRRLVLFGDIGWKMNRGSRDTWYQSELTVVVRERSGP